METEGEDVCVTWNLAEGSDTVGCLLLLINSSTGIMYSSTGSGSHGHNNGSVCFPVAVTGLYVLKAYDINLKNDGSLSREPAYVWPRPVSVTLPPFHLPTSSALTIVSTALTSNGEATDVSISSSMLNPVNCADTTG